MKKLIRAILKFFFPGVANTTSLQTTSFNRLPGGITADNTGMWGLMGFLQNSNLIDSCPLIAFSYGAATAVTLTTAQFLNQVLDVTGSGASPTFTTPTAAQIIAALPPTIPKDGFNFMWYLMNDATGQTITLAGGTGVTINGKTNTIATDTTRIFVVNININAATVTMVNIGGGLTL